MRLPGSRLAELRREHPEADISHVAPGVLGAWVPDEPGSLTGSLTCAYTEDDLARKLDGG